MHSKTGYESNSEALSRLLGRHSVLCVGTELSVVACASASDSCMQQQGPLMIAQKLRIFLQYPQLSLSEDVLEIQVVCASSQKGSNTRTKIERLNRQK